MLALNPFPSPREAEASSCFKASRGTGTSAITQLAAAGVWAPQSPPPATGFPSPPWRPQEPSLDLHPQGPASLPRPLPMPESGRQETPATPRSTPESERSCWENPLRCRCGFGASDCQGPRGCGLHLPQASLLPQPRPPQLHPRRALLPQPPESAGGGGWGAPTGAADGRAALPKAG